MANIYSIHSVGDSIVKFLRDTYPESLRKDHSCDFKLLSSSELGKAEDLGTAVTLYLYRVGIDEHVRNTPHNQRPHATPFPLPLCLHYLVIIWADGPLLEHTLTAWVMSQISQYPILDKSTLSPGGDWAEDERIQIAPAEMPFEDLMRLWDEITPTYRLSLPYLVRGVRIDPLKYKDAPPVVATRYTYKA